MGRHDQEDWGIAEQAAAWVYRLKDPDADRHQSEFEDWCACSATHRREFYLASIVDLQMEALRRHSPVLQRMIEASPPALGGNVIPFPSIQAAGAHISRSTSDVKCRSPGLGRRALAGMCYALALTGIILGAMWNHGTIAHTRTYATDIGERRTIRLEDGSLVELNTASTIVAILTRERRTVELREGEALFTVRHESRPFRVIAANTLIEDLGTRFNIRRQPQSTEVVVTNGSVRVSLRHAARTISRTQVPNASLTAGESVVVPYIAPPAHFAIRTLSPYDLQARIAWRRGVLALNGRSLGDIVAEFNRYNARQLRIADSSIEQLRLGGSFATNDVEGFVKGLRALGVIADPRPSESRDGTVRLIRAEPKR